MNAESTAASGPAAFLSYAPQDANAARRISSALRAAGIEVWFDAEGGLEHGVEWEARIRRQIGACVLFIPIVSANTQARHEGNFRLEWQLAAERSLTLAAGVAFILPVIMDATRETDVQVPEPFRSVQWVRLMGDKVPADMVARFRKVWSLRTGASVAEAPGSTRTQVEQSTSTLPSGSAPRSRRLVFGVIAAAILAAAGWWIMNRGAGESGPTTKKSDAPLSR